MKRKVTKESLVAYIKRLDTRCKKFDDDKFDEIIDDSFSELNTVGHFFYDEDALDVQQYHESGVVKLSYDVERDVIYVYDAFLSVDSKTPHPRSDNMVEVDPRVIGRINVDFSSAEDMYSSYTYHEQSPYESSEDATILITRYYYVPTSEFTEIYMNRDVYKALRQAITASTYMDLHDEKKSEMHYGKMIKNAEAIVTARPFDFDDEPLLRRFIDGC